MATETPGQRLDRKLAEAGEASDKARQKAHDDELKSQKVVQDAINARTHDKDGDPIPLVIEG